MSNLSSPPTATVAVIGAGPVGLAAAAHLVERGLTPIVLEAGEGPGAAISQWGHVRLFSPWRFDIDAAARRLLEAQGWTAPGPDGLPTGNDLIDAYLAPLAKTPELAPHLRYGTRVVAVSRVGVDKTRTIDREGRPYLVRTRTTAGEWSDLSVDAVIDASGTWTQRNPLGAHGLAAPGEDHAAASAPSWTRSKPSGTSCAKPRNISRARRTGEPFPVRPRAPHALERQTALRCPGSLQAGLLPVEGPRPGPGGESRLGPGGDRADQGVPCPQQGHLRVTAYHRRPARGRRAGQPQKGRPLDAHRRHRWDVLAPQAPSPASRRRRRGRRTRQAQTRFHCGRAEHALCRRLHLPPDRGRLVPLPGHGHR